MKIAFIGIVKDGESYIQKNIEYVHTLGHDIYIVENNSKDDTKNILKHLEQRGTVKKNITLDLDNTSALDLCYNESLNDLCPKRVRRLAYIRQHGLDYVLKSSHINYDYICAIDLDFISFDKQKFMDMVAHLEQNKNVDGIFGMSNYTFLFDLPYDYKAVRPYSALPCIFLKFKKYVKVDSAFSGFGIYRTSSIIKTGARYDYETIKHIEHVHFNSYFDNLVVDTQFNPKYNIDTSKIAKLKNTLLAFLIGVVGILLYTYHPHRPARVSYS